MSNTVIPGVYRQHILAGVVIAGHQPVRIDTHGGGPGAEGSHITATVAIWTACWERGTFGPCAAVVVGLSS